MDEDEQQIEYIQIVEVRANDLCVEPKKNAIMIVCTCLNPSHALRQVNLSQIRSYIQM